VMVEKVVEEVVEEESAVVAEEAAALEVAAAAVEAVEAVEAAAAAVEAVVAAVEAAAVAAAAAEAAAEREMAAALIQKAVRAAAAGKAAAEQAQVAAEVVGAEAEAEAAGEGEANGEVKAGSGARRWRLDFRDESARGCREAFESLARSVSLSDFEQPKRAESWGVLPRRPGASSGDLAAQIETGLEIASNVKWRHSRAKPRGPRKPCLREIESRSSRDLREIDARLVNAIPSMRAEGGDKVRVRVKVRFS